MRRGLGCQLTETLEKGKMTFSCFSGVDGQGWEVSTLDVGPRIT